MTNETATQPRLTPLVIRFGRLGDMLLQEPLLHLLRRRYGAPCKILTRGQWTGALYAGHPDVGELWQLRNLRRALALSPERWRAIAKLRAHDGPVYISEDSRSSLQRIVWMLRFAGVPRERCAFIRDIGLRADEHWVDQALRFGRTTPAAFRETDYPWRAEDVHAAPRLYLDANDRADADAWLRQRSLADAPLILLQPGNWHVHRWWERRHADPKFWPVGNWAALLRAMHETLPKANLLLCGTPAESAVCEAIVRATGLVQVKLATTDLPIRRLLAVLERAHSMISVDSGPAHLAASMGCPLVLLYGGKYGPEKWGRRSPFGKPVINLGVNPRAAAVAEIQPAAVIDAWRQLSSVVR
ncbi:MAG TPA: glycosyltransferase family 9 protein [Rudaea sp.]|jgi:heptosyltransferase-2/heptosyltransferase-3